MVRKIKKNQKSFILFTITILMLPFVFYESFACDDLYSLIDKYYSVSKQENYDEYIQLMDTEYIYKNIADSESYENYVKSAFEVYDTKDYDIKYHKCVKILDDSEALVFFNMKSSINSDGKTYNLQRDYVASLRDSNGFKIQFVMDLETFSFHQNMMYSLMYINQTKDILEKDIKHIEEYEKYNENIQLIEEKQDSSYTFLWLILILILVLSLLVIKKYRKRILKKIRNGTKKDENNQIEKPNNKSVPLKNKKGKTM